MNASDSTSAAPGGEDRPVLAVRGRRLFDGARLLPGENATVLIRADLIVGIDTIGAPLPDGAVLHDLGQVTLLPGLIDTHTHLVFDASEQAAAHVQSANDEDLLAHMRTAAGAMLSAGITTARDLGDRGYLSLAVRDDTAADALAGPRLLTAGPPLTPTGGHCWFLGGQADGADGLVRAVRERASRGTDLIKVMVTGGRMTPTTLPHESQYTLAELRAVVDQAHGLGLRIAAHVHGRQGILDALTAGFDTLEHVSFMTAEGFAPDPAVIDAIAEAGAIVSVTAGVLPTYTPPPGSPGAMLRRFMPKMLAHIKNMQERGVRLTLGPDGGIGPGKPHTVLPHAITDLSAAGISTTELLAAATSTAAEACGIGSEVGRLQPGHRADILAVAGNPVADAEAIHRVVAVYRRGRRAC
ncbi:amidohydrolase family protein [Streptacidiphilus sp. MAP12-20]|uniref:amidohydrolase family protein n=1 Tax=Streptacidiphilus sp. MAP12-20 TaxID=3156299 RepID=UPI00351623D2